MHWWWRAKAKQKLLIPTQHQQKKHQLKLQQLQQQEQQKKFTSNNPTLLKSFAPIFYACKILGVIPFDYEAYRQYKVLQASRSGSFLVLIVLILVQFGYGYMALSFSNPEAIFSRSYLGNLVVSGVLTLAPILLLADQLNALQKQRALGKIFQEIDELDARFHSQQINELRNDEITVRVCIMIIITVSFEVLTFMSTLILLPHILRDGFIVLWILNFVPTLYNTFDKIWYMGLTMAMQRRFAAINGVLETLVAQHEHLKVFKSKAYIEEIVPMRQPLSKPIFWHIDSNVSNYEQFLHHDLASVHKPYKRNSIKFVSELSSCHASIEEKFMQLCQLHYDICDIMRQLNRHWSVPILCLMGYGFIITIAQLYFMYLARQGDDIPTLFVSAQRSITTELFLFYVIGKCVALMYCCWRTKLEAKRTAICMHRCALAANRNEVYELINHLSLKLLNHPMHFVAGGFFTLDMSTLYGMLGGLTSYLIIFIQFDLEAKQQQALHGNHTIAKTPGN